MLHKKALTVIAAPIIAVATAFLLEQTLQAASVWEPAPAFEESVSVEAGAMEAESISLIVNKLQPLSASYAPIDLVVPDIPFSFEGEAEKRYLRKPAADAAEELFRTAAKEGVMLYGVSGYRSYKTQSALWRYNVRMKGVAAASRYNASPGMSEHQTGLALDVSAKSVGLTLSAPFGRTKEGLWLADNAHRFGFILRYPEGKEGITGYAYEPWHIRYVGVETARTIYENKLTLEEWADRGVPASGSLQFFPFNLF
ncbi:M15 family metallopeptidase [Paenibacillus thermotolerans]|uniref:M15 family metallopeptidase n=1 Tax=Paenibacillus thermotolerans TaxID=3027807 RepID=UPI0023685CDE|nr:MULTISPECIES: M15 family metallopeptidase [unclassified Paenibacillus]